MNEITKTDNCERAGELVAYFYGEASRAERDSFDAHLAGCGACRDELAAFARVREAVGHWRAEILNGVPALSSGELSSADAFATPPDTPRESARVAALPASRRTALDALGEFFRLSPLWLRAGAATAALAACALVALAAANAEVRWDGGGLAFSTSLRRGEAKTATAPPQAAAPGGKVYSQAELDELVAERDAALRELADTRAQLDDSREANLIAAVGTLEPASASDSISTPGNPRRQRRASPAPAARQKRRPVERDEGDAPRLFDLLSEAN